jgi:hypothetical protein
MPAVVNAKYMPWIIEEAARAPVILQDVVGAKASALEESVDVFILRREREDVERIAVVKKPIVQHISPIHRKGVLPVSIQRVHFQHALSEVMVCSKRGVAIEWSDENESRDGLKRGITNIVAEDLAKDIEDRKQSLDSSFLEKGRKKAGEIRVGKKIVNALLSWHERKRCSMAVGGNIRPFLKAGKAGIVEF